MQCPFGLQISDLEFIESVIEQELTLEETEKIIGGSMSPVPPAPPPMPLPTPLPNPPMKQPVDSPFRRPMPMPPLETQ